MEKEKPFVIPDTSLIETEPPAASSSIASSNHLAESSSNHLAESPSKHLMESTLNPSDESSSEVSTGLEKTSTPAVPPPLSDVVVVFCLNHRAIPPHLFVKKTYSLFQIHHFSIHIRLLLHHLALQVRFSQPHSSQRQIHDLFPLFYPIGISPHLPKHLPNQRPSGHRDHQHRHEPIEVRSQQWDRLHLSQQLR